MEITKYAVRKSLSGDMVVKYRCPRCNANLTSPLEEAGQSDECPECQISFTVPGQSERQKWAAQAAAKLEEKKARDRERREEARRWEAEHLAAANLRRNSEQRRTSSPGNRYGALETLAALYQICGYILIVLAIGGLFALFAGLASDSEYKWSLILSGVVLFATGAIGAITSFATAEGIHLAIDVEGHLRKSLDLLTKIAQGK